MASEADDDLLLVGGESSADVEIGARKPPKPPSLMARLSFRSKSRKQKSSYEQQEIVEEEPPHRHEGGGATSPKVAEGAPNDGAMYGGEAERSDLRKRAALLRVFGRAGRHSPLRKIQGYIHNYFYEDEESMAMEQASTRQKLMDHKVRSLDVFDRLRAVYKVPHANKLYDTTTPYRLLFRREENMLKLVLMRMDFWILLGVHILFHVLYFKTGRGMSSNPRLGPDQGPRVELSWPRMSTSMLAIPGMLLTFLLVFYNNQSYSRFMEQYWHTQRQLGAIGEVVLLLRVLVPDDLFEGAKAVRTEIWRLVHATHLLGYTGLPQQRSQDIDRWAWLYAHERNLLKASQIQRLKPLLSVGAGNQPFKETMSWILSRIAELEKQGYIDPEASVVFSKSLWNFRGNIDVLYGMVFQPIPFAYFHLTNTVLIGYLVVLSYSFVFVSPYLSIVGYALILFSFMGLRELSSVLSDPFGCDDTDIPVFDHVNNQIKNMAALIDLPVTAHPDHTPLPPLLSDGHTMQDDNSAIVK